MTAGGNPPPGLGRTPGMRLRRIAVLAAVVLGAVAAPSPAHAVDLFGRVGPDTTILLRDAAGQPVRQLDPGTYRITVEDLSDFHNFHLTGPGVNLATEVERIETVVWEVTLVEGVYGFVCDPHRSEMQGSFTVGNPPPPPPPPKRLVATVTASRITLTMDGRRVSILDAGAYVFTVRDRSRRHNFHLVGPGVNRRTTVAQVRTVTWRLTLRAGTFRFVSDPQARRLRGVFRVR